MRTISSRRDSRSAARAAGGGGGGAGWGVCLSDQVAGVLLNLFSLARTLSLSLSLSPLMHRGKQVHKARTAIRPAALTWVPHHRHRRRARRPLRPLPARRDAPRHPHEHRRRAAGRARKRRRRHLAERLVAHLAVVTQHLQRSLLRARRLGGVVAGPRRDARHLLQQLGRVHADRGGGLAQDLGGEDDGEELLLGVLHVEALLEARDGVLLGRFVLRVLSHVGVWECGCTPTRHRFEKAASKSSQTAAPLPQTPQRPRTADAIGVARSSLIMWTI
jgi:hypothetical protein